MVMVRHGRKEKQKDAQGTKKAQRAARLGAKSRLDFFFSMKGRSGKSIITRH